ncbi:MAG: Ig-like domain-containing protein [Candidatus Krumholzibacteria bacterium]|nr:Ig-like domain-containing protein [Candidatus Krumholzibacteria bacterium]
MFLAALVALAFVACGDDETPPVTGGGPPDATAPGVDSVVAVDDHHVEVYYDEAVQKESAERASYYTIVEGTPSPVAFGAVPGDTLVLSSVSLKPDGKTAVISMVDLMSDVPYDLSVCCVRDVSGNQMAAPLTTPFAGTSAQDNTAPEIVSRSPAPDATGVGTGQSVVIQFSEIVVGYTVLDGLSWTGGGGDVLWDIESEDEITFVITPVLPLSTNTLYTVSLTGVSDYSANVMPMVEWSFRTRTTPDTTPPALVSSSPSDGQTNVSVDANLAFTFSEAMDQNQFQPLLTPNPGDGLLVWSNGGRTVTFDPDLPLQDDTQYLLFILPGEVRDLAGNGIANPVSIRFSTGPNFATGSFAGRVSGDPGTPTANPAGAVVIAPNVLPFNGNDDFDVMGSDVVDSGGGSNYSISALPDGVYYPVSAKDSNGDGDIDPDKGDAIGAYGLDIRQMDMIPDSVVISGGNAVNNVDFPLFDQSAVAGTFAYDGTMYTGDYQVYIGAFDVNGFDINNLGPPDFGTDEWWPYNVQFGMSEMDTPGFAAGNYYIGAYMDVDPFDVAGYNPATDPAGFYGGVPNPTAVDLTGGKDAVGIHISLADPVAPFAASPVSWRTPDKKDVEWFQRLSAAVRRAAEQSKTAPR